MGPAKTERVASSGASSATMRLAWYVLAPALFCSLALDTFDLYQKTTDPVTSDHWFDSNWIRQPTENLLFSTIATRDHWQLNAIGSECWLVRELDFRGHRFWTVLERIPVETSVCV